MKKFLALTSMGLLLALTACGDLGGTSDTGAADSSDDIVATSVWEAAIDPDTDGSTVGMSCMNLDTAVTGEKIICTNYFTITNISSMPQELHGYYYLVASGITYLSNDGYESSKAINPQDYVTRSIEFDVPYGSDVTSLYMAESPDGDHMWDLDLNISVHG
jgi:hypothetical protein